MSSEIVIRTPRLSVSTSTARLSSVITLPDSEDQELWFDVPAEHAGALTTETCDGFVVALLPLAVMRGWNVRVLGSISSRLYYNINLGLSEVLRNILPDGQAITLTVKTLNRQNLGGSGVFTGFSAGVDSLATLLDHMSDRVPPEYRVTHLLLNNVGSHGQSEDDLQVFRQRYDRLLPHAKALGLPLISVNSNMDQVLGLNFQLTHTMRNTAVALVLQKACGKFLYSSSGHYRETRVGPGKGTGYVDNITLPMLSTETTDCISTGSQYTRFEKTQMIAPMPLARKALDVCVEPRAAKSKINCSRCWKCLRTGLALEMIGALPAFSTVFDIESCCRLRNIYLLKVLTSKDPLLQELRENFAAWNFKVPLALHLLAKVTPARLAHVMAEVAGQLDEPNLITLARIVGQRALRKIWRKIMTRLTGRPATIELKLASGTNQNPANPQGLTGQNGSAKAA